MAKKSFINLGEKSSPVSVPEKPDKNRVNYPGMCLHCDHPIDFPKGAFHGRMKMAVRRSEASVDEKGKARHTYHIDIHGVHPEFESAKEDAAEGKEEAPDAAMALMESMGRASQKKRFSDQDQ